MHVDGEPRIEVWIKPAYVLSLPSWMDGLSITQANPDEMTAWAEAHPGVPVGLDSTLYVIRTGTFAGWVVGGSLNTREDDEDYFAASPWDVEQLE